ncbi:hypothetical protein Y032_0239g3311 [Ancylostoma ceylanicum]|uniref:Major facilitator superfamily (MFS) profile domain-containing protein n=1 Tax=Ancylostoma ceylanicum TaxID=53326 RepID=A0A016SDY5_9BILA|nr:hypothetical protein Y032_0239g3311 [Ancylostoma ceylanicum]
MSKRWDRIRLIAICCTLSFSVNFQYAFSSTYTNSAVHSFRRFLSHSDEANSTEGGHGHDSSFSWLWNVIVNVWFVGFFVGIWVSRVMSDKYGRKVAFLAGNVLNVIGSAARCLAIVLNSPETLVGARILCGFATAIGYCSLVLYLQEVAPSSMRGSTSCLNGVIYSLIAFFGITLGNDSFLGKNLLFYLGAAIPPCVFAVIALAIFPETPKFLVAQERYDEACSSVRFYYGESANVSDSVKAIERDVNEASSGDANLVDLFMVHHLRAALLLTLAALQNTEALWAILFSSTFYLEKAGLELWLAQWSSSLMAGAYVAGTTTSAIIIERYGRRKVLIIANILNMMSLALYVLCAEARYLFEPIKYGCLAMFVLFGYTFGSGVGPVARFIGIELVPLRYRSMLTAVCFAENTVMSFLLAFAVLPLFNLIGPSAFLVLFVGPSALCTLYLHFYLPETRCRNIEDIICALKGSS